jgi:hypothetical protein
MFVFVTEMINTAVEKVVDLHTKNYNKAAKNIKDIAASSVLIAALFSAIVGIAIFNDFEKLIFVIEKIFLNFLNCALFLIYMLINYFFIFKI